MPEPTTTARGTVAGAVVLAAVCVLFWLILLPGLSELDSSDPAGNGMAQGFAALEAVALWILLAIHTFVCWAKGRMPEWAAFAAAILVPGSGFAAAAALDLLARPEMPPYLWPLVVLWGAPPLIIVYGLWAVTPSWRERLPANTVSAIVWGGVLALCLSVPIMNTVRAAKIADLEATYDKWRAEVDATPAGAPLWAWTRLLGHRFHQEKDVVEKIRALDRRQADAETMLARGDFPLAYLSAFDLDATPAACEGARAELKAQVAPLVAKTPQARPYSDVAEKVDAALAAMRWLVGYGCAADAESAAWETMAKGYRDPSYSVYELAELRDPKTLGGKLRDGPERFSQLGPQARLWAWLSFADRPEYRDAAFAGARRVATRNEDAIAMLEDKNWGPGIFMLIQAIPTLDLEASPRLCRAALAHVRDDLDHVYRPTADDPRRYSELPERLGAGAPLTALQWLAGRGCDAEAELNEAETVVRAYQDSPDRQAMLANLAALRRRTP